MIALLFVSFFAGILTVLAPCVLPVLPVIIGGSLQDRNPLRPFIITFSLGASIVLFTLLLKATTYFIDIPQLFWKLFAAVIIMFFGFTLIFPNLWTKISGQLGFEHASQQALQQSNKKGGMLGMILIGVSLGPVFASCSPTYFLILGTVLPQSFFTGLLYLIAYGLGLSLILFLVAFFGQKALAHLKWAADPNGWFKKFLGILLILVGIAVLTGVDKRIEAAIVNSGYWGVGEFEENILDTIRDQEEL